MADFKARVAVPEQASETGLAVPEIDLVSAAHALRADAVAAGRRPPTYAQLKEAAYNGAIASRIERGRRVIDLAGARAAFGLGTEQAAPLTK